MVVARKQQQCKQRVYLGQANQDTLIFILANHERELNQAGATGPSAGQGQRGLYKRDSTTCVKKTPLFASFVFVIQMCNE